jgi:hypothetical protein
LRKKPQLGKPQTKIPLKDPTKYPQLWFDHQDDLDAFDSLMRKKVYYQNSYGEKMDKDFVINGSKPTFGIFSKDFRERRLQISSLLQKQTDFVSF